MKNYEKILNVKGPTTFYVPFVRYLF